MEKDNDFRTSVVFSKEVLNELIEENKDRPIFVNGVPVKEMTEPGTAPETKGANVKGVLFIIAFIGAVIAMVVFSQTEPLLCISTAGAMFLFFGLVSLFQNKFSLENAMALLFPLIGFFAFAAPLLGLYSKKHPEVIDLGKNGGVTLALIGMAVVGVCIAVLSPISQRAMRKRCPMPVTAKCVFRLFRFTKSSAGGRTRTGRIYSPVWQYEVDGNVYITSENVYSGENVPEIFEEQEIFYSPEDPSVIMRHLKVANIVPVVGGAAFAACGIFGLIMMRK